MAISNLGPPPVSAERVAEIETEFLQRVRDVRIIPATGEFATALAKLEAELQAAQERENALRDTLALISDIARLSRNPDSDRLARIAELAQEALADQRTEEAGG